MEIPTFHDQLAEAFRRAPRASEAFDKYMKVLAEEIPGSENSDSVRTERAANLCAQLYCNASVGFSARFGRVFGSLVDDRTLIVDD